MHVLVGGKTFHDREEVETLRAALAAIEWPDDELSVFATLRGSLFAIGDEELLDWKQRFPSGVSSVPDSAGGVALAHLQPIVEALTLLQKLHRRAQLHSRRRHDPAAAERDARARRARASPGRRAGARQRASRRGARAAVRGGRRHLVPRVRRGAAHRRRRLRRPPKRRSSKRAATASA